jgi:hypothetical protein
MGEPGNGAEGVSTSAGQETVAAANERRYVCIGIGQLMDSITSDQMIGTDLDLTAMVRWLSNYTNDDPQVRYRHAAHAHRLIAFWLGAATTRDNIARVEEVLGPDETSLIMAEVAKLASLGSAKDGHATATEEALAYWGPVMDDLDFIVGSGQDPYRFWPQGN